MYKHKPEWLRIRLPADCTNIDQVEKIIQGFSLYTVCQEANCPNKSECYNNRIATFMILGNICTRNCTFCNVPKGRPSVPDPHEHLCIALAVEKLKLKHVVVTSVTRDDLPDGGADIFSQTVKQIIELDNNITVEVLIPDFSGSFSSIQTVIKSRPQIIGHNMETVKRLYPYIRPMAIYKRSLKLLESVKLISSDILTKSGIMLGLGETESDVLEVMQDILNTGCDILTIGQYLSPSKEHYQVVEYIHPSKFEEFRQAGLSMGFKSVLSAPLMRSSYHAHEAYAALKNTSSVNATNAPGASPF